MISWIARGAEALAVRAMRVVPRALATPTWVELCIADLSPEFEGYTVALVADLHHAPTASLEWLQHAVALTNAAAPDLIALLGDYGVSFTHARSLSRFWYRDALPEMLPVLRQLRAADGIVGVLGNHDYDVDPGIVRDWFRGFGGRLLENQVRLVARGDTLLRFVGFDDTAGVPPLTWATSGSASPTIVLTHHPDSIESLPRSARVDVVVAGHTHGGQIVLPGYGAPITMSRVCGRRSASGWVPHPRAPLYVSRGLGVQPPLPVRFRCPPELTILRLRVHA